MNIITNPTGKFFSSLAKYQEKVQANMLIQFMEDKNEVQFVENLGKTLYPRNEDDVDQDQYFRVKCIKSEDTFLLNLGKSSKGKLWISFNPNDEVVSMKDLLEEYGDNLDYDRILLPKVVITEPDANLLQLREAKDQFKIIDFEDFNTFGSLKAFEKSCNLFIEKTLVR